MANERNPSLATPQPGTRFVSAPNITPTGVAAGAVKEVGESLVALRQQQIGRELQGELIAEQDAVLNSLEQLPAAPELSGDEATALNEFATYMQDLDQAARQRTRSISDLKIMQERRLRDYMSRYPQLAPQLQGAATGILGYQPLGARLREAEKAATAASAGSSTNDTVKFMRQASKELGIDQSLYITDPAEYWRRTTTEMARNERVALNKRKLEGMQTQMQVDALVQAPIFNEFVKDTAVSTWTQKIAPAVREFYDTLGMDQSTSPEMRGQLIQAAMNDGRLDRAKLALQAQKEMFLIEAYDDFFFQEGQMAGSLPSMSREDFAKQMAPITAQFDAAIALMGSENGMLAVNRMNDAIDANILLSIPTDIRALSYIGERLFSKDNAFSATIGRSAAAIQLTHLLSDFIGREFGAQMPGSAAGLGQPLSNPDSPDAVDNRALQTPTALMSPRQLGITANDFDQGKIDKAYATVATDMLPQWVEQVANDEPDADYTAATVLRYLQGYGTMIVNAELGKAERPSKETDFATLSVVADPSFAEVWKRGTKGLSRAPEIARDLNMVIRGRFVEQIYDDEERVRSMLNEPDMQFTGDADEYGVPEQFNPGPGFVRSEFYRNIQASVDPNTRTVTFEKRPNAPEFNQLTNRVLASLNDMDPQDNNILASLAMAWAHMHGRAGPRAYDWAFRNMLGIGNGR